MSPLQFYREQAAQQALAAQQADLENVRERCSRAARAWDALASRSERSSQTRADAAAAKLLDLPGEGPARGSATIVPRPGESR